MVKEKKKENKEIDVNSKVNKDSDLEFDVDSEHNLDLAFAKGILFALNKFSLTKFVKKRMLKSATFLRQTNKVQKNIIDDLFLNSKEVNGMSGKQWIKIINIMCNASNIRKELKNENKLTRFFNR